MKKNELKDNIKKQTLKECIEFCEDRGIDSEKLRIFLCNQHFRLDLETKIIAHLEGAEPANRLKAAV